MIESNKLDKGCLIAILLAAVISLALLCAGNQAAPVQPAERRTSGGSPAYADTLFDPARVHTINLLVSDVNWSYMVRHAMEEQYVLCDAEIDGELVSGVAIRPKGNSSLASIAGQGSDRFSFKLEFDHYAPGTTFHGLDKLALNNLGQDISCLKDFLAYQMMAGMGVPGPMCAYTLVQRNGMDFGLYLAVEAVEDSFAARVYGEDWTGNIYRPDVYAIESITPAAFADAPKADIFQLDVTTLSPGDRVDAIGPIINLAFASLADQARISAGGYAGDAPDAYRVVFDTAVFDPSAGDADRYISAVRTLCTADDPLRALDADALCRYFAVHNFLNNYDSYTGIFAHNYYLCERDGRLSLIPWDYNLAFGAFSAESAYKCFARDSRYYQPMDLGASMHTEKSFVNYPIDTPLISAEMTDRPLFSRLVANKAGMTAYHSALRQLLTSYFDQGSFDALARSTAALIRPYVAQGLTFYTAADFDLAADSVLQYAHLRADSIRGQLEGTIPSTLEGQRTDWSTLVETGDLDLSRTIDFGGLAFGITSEEVCAILGAVFDGYEVADVEALATYLAEDPTRIAPLIVRVISSSKLVSGALLNTVLPPVTLIACLIVLVIAVKRSKKAGRDRSCS